MKSSTSKEKRDKANKKSVKRQKTSTTHAPPASSRHQTTPAELDSDGSDDHCLAHLFDEHAIVPLSSPFVPASSAHQGGGAVEGSQASEDAQKPHASEPMASHSAGLPQTASEKETPRNELPPVLVAPPKTSPGGVHESKTSSTSHADKSSSSAAMNEALSLPFPAMSADDPEYYALAEAIQRTGIAIGDNAGTELFMSQSQEHPPSSALAEVLSLSQGASSSAHGSQAGGPTNPIDALREKGHPFISIVDRLHPTTITDVEEDETEDGDGQDRQTTTALPDHLGIFVLPHKSALITRPFMLQCAIVYNARHRAFICTHPKCMRIIGVGDLPTHLGKTKHPAYQILDRGPEKAMLEAHSICTFFGLNAQERTNGAVDRVYQELLPGSFTSPAQPVEGLPIHVGVSCAQCPDKHCIYDGTRTLRQGHYKATHGEGTSSHPVHYQKLNDNCLLDGKTRPRVVVVPRYRAVLNVHPEATLKEGGDEQQDNTEQAAAFATLVVQTNLAPRVIGGSSSNDDHTRGHLLQPAGPRHTDYLLDRSGFVHMFGERTMDIMQALHEATAPPLHCTWSASALGGSEAILPYALYLYIDQGINARVMALSHTMRGILGGGWVDDDAKDASSSTFKRVGNDTIKKYIADVGRLTCLVMRQALYKDLIRPKIQDQDLRARLDLLDDLTPKLPNDILDTVLNLNTVLLTIPLPTTRRNQGAAGAATSSLFAPEARSLVEAVHALILELCFCPVPLCQPQIHSVLQRFLLGAHYNSHEGFANLKNMYNTCSSLKYLIRGAAYFSLQPPWGLLTHPRRQAYRHLDTETLVAFLKKDKLLDSQSLTISPLSMIYETGRLAHKLSDSVPKPPQIEFVTVGDDTRLRVRGIRLDFDAVLIAVTNTRTDILDLVKILLKGVPDSLLARLHLGKDLLRTQASSTPYAVHCNLQSQEVSYNFARDAQNEELRQVASEILNEIVKFHGWRLNHAPTAVDDMWKWVECVDTLMTTVLFRNHLTSGPPLRGTELAAIQVARTHTCSNHVHVRKNDDTGDYTVVLTPLHNKINQLVVTPRSTPRTLDPFASRFLIDYVSILRPLYFFLLQHVRGHDNGLETAALYVSNGKRFSDEQVRTALAEHFDKYELPGITIATYRQGVVLWTHTRIPTLMDEYAKFGRLPSICRAYFTNYAAQTSEGINQVASEMYDELAGHNTDTALRDYAHTDQDHTDISALRFDDCGVVCLLWQYMWRCDEGAFNRHKRQMIHFARSVVEPGLEASVTAADNLCTSITSSAAMVSQPAQATQLGAAASASAGQSPPCTTHVPLEVEGKVLACLGGMLSTDQPRFQSVDQSAAFYALWNVKDSLLLVLPTGAGKSLLFVLLAKVLSTKKFVVVIVPLSGLADSLVDRAKQMGVQAAWAWKEFGPLWKQDRTSFAGGLVVVQHEDSHHDPNFGDFLNSQQDSIHAVIADEAHLLHFYGTTFRRKDLRTFSGIPEKVPVVGMSATLPPTLEHRIAHYLIPRKQGFDRILRVHTAATHMHYEVRCKDALANGFLISEMTRLQHEYLGNNPNASRGIVFFNSRTTLHDMAVEARQDFNVFSYHGIGGGDGHTDYAAEKQERRAIMSAFVTTTDTDPRSKWLFSTSAGGTGIDLKGIRVVIVYEWCYGQLELCQMFGRCRAPADASIPCLGLILTSPAAIAQFEARIEEDGRAPLQRHDSPEDMQLRLASMKAHLRYLKGGSSQDRSSCLRHELEEYVAGAGISCMSAGARLCGVCCQVLARQKQFLQLETPAIHPTMKAQAYQSWDEPDTRAQTPQVPVPQQNDHKMAPQEQRIPVPPPQHQTQQPQRYHSPAAPRSSAMATSSTPIPLPSTPAMPRFTPSHVNSCLRFLDTKCQEDQFLRACMPCLVATTHRWGHAGDDDRIKHSPPDHNYRSVCPQFKKLGILFQRCTTCFEPYSRGHACAFRGTNSLLTAIRSQDVGCCYCCQLDNNSNNLMTTSFHAKPKHSFGPVAQQGCQLPCKLFQTDLYLNTATLLWYHKHDLLYSLVRNHWGYRRKWDAFFSRDNTKTFGMQHKLPLREFYEWLHEYWYDATTPIRCCHAIFILFIEVADKGKRSIEEIAHRPIYFPLNVSFADVAPSQEARG